MIQRAKTAISRVAMISPHGYLDGRPKLGQIDTGGQGIFVVQMAKALAAQNIAVDIFTRHFDDRPFVEEVAPGVRIVRLKAGPAKFVRKEDIGQYLSIFAKEFLQFANGQPSYDVLHGHYWDGGAVASFISSLSRVPMVFTPHSLGAWKRSIVVDGAEVEQLFRYKERISAEHAIFGAAQRITGASSMEVELFRRFYGIGSEKVDTVPPGFDNQRFCPSEDKISPYMRPYIFSTSRHVLSKGFDHLLAAFGLIAKETDAMVVIGGGSADPQGEELKVRQMLERMIEELSLRGRVHILGYLSDEELVRHYRNAVLFTLCSAYEPFGIVVLEAMACAAPVVVSSAGGIREVLRDGENGLLADPSDHQALANAFRKIVHNREYGRFLGLAGAQMVHEQFTWRHVAGLLRQSYEKAASK
jgi:mannosylfructose-phosphate synthase